MAGRRWRWASFLGIGVLLGVAGGVAASWTLAPVPVQSASPAELKPERKVLYVELISSGYALDTNLQVAIERLQALGEGDPGIYVARVAEGALDQGASLQQVREMARLAQDLGSITPRLVAYIATPFQPTASPVPTVTATSTETSVPTGTPTPEPTLTSQPTQTNEPTATSTPSPSPTGTAAPTVTSTATSSPERFALVSRQSLCIRGSGRDRIAIYALDASGRGLPGVRVTVSWPGGEEFLFTGLKPDINPGYADFEMSAGTAYAVRVGQEGGDIARDLIVTGEPCTELEGASHRQWELTFRRSN